MKRSASAVVKGGLKDGSGTISTQSGVLAETQYSVNIWVVIYRDGRVHPLVKNRAVSFQVFDSDPATSARGTYVDRMPGVVTPKLGWRTSEESAVAGV